MSYEQFIQELNKTYKISRQEELEGLGLQHYRFAGTTNSRGLKAIESMENSIGFHFKGARMLDIGCAYGGFCIEAARKGAIAYGIDINRRLIELARTNAQDERVDGEIHFSVVDATSMDLPKLLPSEFFDLVVVNDVFEHVYDTAKLLENISRITADNGKLYFRIPNGLCTKFMRREGHRAVAGISVIDPSYWHYRVKKDFSIYYRRWDYYAALLLYYGYRDIRLLNFGKTFAAGRAQLVKHLQAEFEGARNAISTDIEHETSIAQSYKHALSARIMEVEKEMQDDLRTMPDAQLCWKYLTDFWQGIATKRSDNSAVVKQHRLLRVGFAATEQAIRSSFSYRLGNMLVQAVYKPGRNTVLLPYRLLRLCVAELRKRRAGPVAPPLVPPASVAALAKQGTGPSGTMKPDATGKPRACSSEDTVKIQLTEVQLAHVVLSSCTRMVEEAYIRRFGAEKGRLGSYKENDWRRIEYVSSLLPDGETVLDVGIGNGAFMNLMASLNKFQKILGMDIRRHSKFTMLFESNLYQIMYGSVTNLPFADKCIDVVTCMEVLEHLEKQSFMAALRELRRVSRFLIATVPYNEPEPRPSYHKMRFTDSDLLAYFPHGKFILLRKSAGTDWITIVERS